MSTGQLWGAYKAALRLAFLVPFGLSLALGFVGLVFGVVSLWLIYTLFEHPLWVVGCLLGYIPAALLASCVLALPLSFIFFIPCLLGWNPMSEKADSAWKPGEAEFYRWSIENSTTPPNNSGWNSIDIDPGWNR
jgi:hypothetical protein